MKPNYVPLAIASVVFLASIGAYGVWYAQVQQESAHVAALEQQLKDKSQATTRIAQAKAQLAELAPEESSIDQYFVSPNDIVPFLEQFSETGKFLGSTVDVVSVAATPGSPVGTLNLSLRISGPFESVMRTLGSIEYGPYDITTTSVVLDANPVDAGKTRVWTAGVTLTIGTQATTATVSQPVIQPRTQPTATSTPKATPAPVATSSAPVTTATNTPSVAI